MVVMCWGKNQCVNLKCGVYVIVGEVIKLLL